MCRIVAAALTSLLLTGLPGWALGAPPRAQPLQSFVMETDGDQSSAWGLAFSPDGKTLAVANYDGTIRLWDVTAGVERRVLRGHSGPVNSVAFSPDGTRLASGGIDGTVRTWDPATGRLLRIDLVHEGPVVCVAFSPDGRRLATAGQDTMVNLLDSGTGDVLRGFQGHTNCVNRVAFSPDGKKLASAGWDTTVRLWDIATGAKTLLYKGDLEPVGSLLFSPDGATVTLSTRDARILMLPVRGGTPLSSIKLKSEEPVALAYSSDGKTLAVIGFDWSSSYGMAVGIPGGAQWREVRYRRQLEFWDTASMVVTGKIPLGTTGTNCVAYSPDGRLVATAGWESSVQLWPVPAKDSLPGLPLAAGAPPPSEREEWLRYAIAWDDARRLADIGKAPEGLALLEKGQARAEQLAKAGESWQAELLALWQRAVREYIRSRASVTVRRRR